MKIKFLSLITLMLACQFGFSQSQPTSFDLSTGNYLFDQWDSLAMPATYPPSMIFHTVDNEEPAIADTGISDWNCSYNLNAGPRFKGKGINGIGMVNTGTTQTASCASNNTTPVFVGELVLSLNTLGRTNIQLSWIGRMISSFNYVPSGGLNPVNRFFSLVCQYRIGETGPFSTFSNDSIFNCYLNDSTYHAQGFADTLLSQLPQVCEDQPIVQLRWLYFQNNAGNGPRPELAVDDISVTSSISTNLGNSILDNEFSIFPNPSKNGIFNLSETTTYRVFNAQGGLVFDWEKNKQLDLSGKPKGIYLLTDSNGNSLKVISE